MTPIELFQEECMQEALGGFLEAEKACEKGRWIMSQITKARSLEEPEISELEITKTTKPNEVKYSRNEVTDVSDFKNSSTFPVAIHLREDSSTFPPYRIDACQLHLQYPSFLFPM